MSFKRVVLIVLDGCGVGELPDASEYNDSGASTLVHCAEVVEGLHMPVCQSLGLGNIIKIQGIPPIENPIACYGKMAELSIGKDSTVGHWEIAGIITDKPFPTYPNGFPKELVETFEKKAHVKVIGNCPASGTEIIERLGEQHIRTKEIILYTSADSVFQIAAHEEIYSTEELYTICKIAREILIDEHAVARVIARPFNGKNGSFYRVAGRKDYSLSPQSQTILSELIENNYKTLAIGKIFDLFNGDSISKHVKTKSNKDGIRAIIDCIANDKTHQFIFANLVEFDEHCGHRRDPKLFATKLEEFDLEIQNVLSTLRNDDLLIITADHGCDPTFKNHTDHTREHVPLLVFSKNMKQFVNLGIRNSFADIANTIADNFDIKYNFHGASFYKEILL